MTRALPPVPPLSRRIDDAQAPLFLVVDAGSSWLRASLYDAHALPVRDTLVRLRAPFLLTPDGGVERDAAEAVELVASLIDDVVEAAGTRAADILAVTFASLASTVVGVDAEGAPVTPLYPYHDNRPEVDARQLRTEVDAEVARQRTGCPLHTAYLPARLRWLRRTQPDRWRQVALWLPLTAYLSLVFNGRAVSSTSIAAWSGLLNRETGRWDEEWLEALGLTRESLPDLDDSPLQGLTPAYAKRWPALASRPWFPGVADGFGNNVGTGCTEASRMAVSLATTAALRVMTDRPPQEVPPGLWCYRVDSSRWLLGGALNEGGRVMSWARDVLRVASLDSVIDEAAVLQPDAHGLTVLPFLAGERSPGWNPALRGALLGVDLGTKPAQIVRALMEAVAYRMLLVERELEGCAGRPARFIASGGSAVRTPAWLQIIADVLDRPLELCADPEATSRGAAILAAQALGLEDDLLPAETVTTFTPDASRHARYQEGLRRHQGLYELVADWTATHDP